MLRGYEVLIPATNGLCSFSQNENFVVGQNPLLEGRSCVGLHTRYKTHLHNDMVSALISCNQSWTSIKVSLFGSNKCTDRSVEHNGTEPPLKKRRSKCTWKEDKNLSLAVLRVAISNATRAAWIAPSLNAAWFETLVVQAGIVPERSAVSLLL